jgi:hypothetical protein
LRIASCALTTEKTATAALLGAAAANKGTEELMIPAHRLFFFLKEW